ncbi:hypothetical protein D3C71_1177550 [compost metagenome]
MGCEGFFTVRIPLIVEEHIARCLIWRHFAEVDGRGIAVFGAQQHKAPATEIPRLRMRYRQGITHGDGGVDGITALFENIHADLRSHRINGRHHPLLRPHGMENIFFHAVGDWRCGRRIRRHGKCAAGHQRSDRYPAQKRWFYHCCSPGEGSQIPV